MSDQSAIPAAGLVRLDRAIELVAPQADRDPAWRAAKDDLLAVRAELERAAKVERALTKLVGALDAPVPHDSPDPDRDPLPSTEVERWWAAWEARRDEALVVARALLHPATAQADRPADPSLAALARRYLDDSDLLMSWDNAPDSHESTHRQPGAGLYRDVRADERRSANRFAAELGLESRDWRVLRPAAWTILKPDPTAGTERLDLDGLPFCPSGYARRYHAIGECACPTAEEPKFWARWRSAAGGD